jgi:stage IV sporulation protein FB
MQGKQISLQISSGFFLMLSASLLILPLRLVGGWLIAASVHELAHIIALKDHVIRLNILPLGAKIETMPITLKQELIAALAGPFASLLLITLYRVFPSVAICGLVQFLYNMIPVYPMDGGRALRCIIIRLCGISQANNIMGLMRVLILLLLLSFSCYATIVFKTALPALASIVLIIRSAKGKIPCKYRVRGVQ